jgi:hypothetical protein
VLLLPPTVRSQLDLRVYDEERWQYDGKRGGLSAAPVKSGRQIDNFYHLDVFDETLSSTDTPDERRQRALAELAPRALLCELSAGDALYIPHPWAHAVLSTNDDGPFALNLAVNVWWETAEQHARQARWRYACTAVGVAFWLVSMRPQLLRRLNPWASAPAAPAERAAAAGKGGKKGKGKRQ